MPETSNSRSGSLYKEDGSDGDDEKVSKGKNSRREGAFYAWSPTAAAVQKRDARNTRPANNSEPVHDFSRYGCFKLEGTQWIKLGTLGSGAFGTVYAAITDYAILFAVKEVSLSNQASKGEDALRKEIEFYSRFKHENIVRYLGTDEDNEKLYVFLELMPKGSLSTLYGKDGLAKSQVPAYTRQILNGLKYLHDQNVIHRDIKCANILVGANGSVKLADFGLAKAIEMNSAKTSVGTFYWMAPEVANKNRRSSQLNGSYGLEADIWSVGCTVLEMLTCEHPYPGLEPMQALFKSFHGEPPQVPESLSKEARDFIRRCLQVNPDDRPSAAQLLDDPFVRKPSTSGFA